VNTEGCGSLVQGCTEHRPDPGCYEQQETGGMGSAEGIGADNKD